MKISLHGQLVDEREAMISIYDHGFLYGMGLFETFRTYGGRPFLLQAHLDRLTEACGQLHIRYRPDPVHIQNKLMQLLEANRLDEGYFRLTVTGGVGQVGLPLHAYDQPQEIIYVKALPSTVDLTGGTSLQLLKQRRNSPEGRFRFKSLHYMNNIIGKQELQSYPWARQAEGLFLNEQGHVAEGIVSNVFFIREQACHTPSISTGILAGVTRRFVLDCCELLGIRYEEGYFTWNDLLAADEVFITNSIQEIVPISKLFDTEGRLAEKPVHQQGSYTERLMDMYRRQISQMR